MAFFIPQNPLGLVLGIIVCPIVYLFFLSLLKFFSKDDIDHFRGYSSKFGPLSSLFNKLLNVIERIEFRNDWLKDYLNNKSLRQLYLDRKYERFKELLNKYSEN